MSGSRSSDVMGMGLAGIVSAGGWSTDVARSRALSTGLLESQACELPNDPVDSFAR
jgi:hypothetical protein